MLIYLISARTGIRQLQSVKGSSRRTFVSLTVYEAAVYTQRDAKAPRWRRSAASSPVAVESFHVRHQRHSSCHGQYFIMVSRSMTRLISTTIPTFWHCQTAV